MSHFSTELTTPYVSRAGGRRRAGPGAGLSNEELCLMAEVASGSQACSCLHSQPGCMTRGPRQPPTPHNWVSW